MRIMVLWMVAISTLGPSVAVAQRTLPDAIADWDLTPTGVQLVVKLDWLRDQAKRAVEVQANAKIALGDFEWFNFRFSRLRVQVDAVDIHQGTNATEAAVELRGGVEAQRERRRYGVAGPWDANGGKRVASVSAATRLQLSVTGDQLTLTLVGDSLRVESDLNPIHGAAVSVQLNGMLLGTEKIEFSKAFSGLIFDGVKLVHVRVTQLTDKTATVDVDVEAN